MPQFDLRPACRWKHEDCERARGEILLIAQVFVGRDKQVERRLGSGQ
jgi:hypothetical protein